ncbi:hypothetical protein [Calothrix sp. 336/3]|uniref:hypothetical protein n=1 Tax=Calothrix sp. 336/3 TaxID=1337936 RepID=UPI0004E2CEB3|nr:hypothetical protein [Calothrix sp. 336/3]AKG20834.1 hypothetical protein IJ00_05495 [Calothrix sp. 336/3]
MHEDLQGLELGRKELQRLTSLPVEDELIIITHPLKQISRKFIHQAQGAEGATVIFLGLSFFAGSYIISDVIIRLFALSGIIHPFLGFILLLIVSGAIGQLMLYLLWKHRRKQLQMNMSYSLKILLKDVERYNAIIKAIEISDQIEAAGNIGVSIQDRDKVLEALKMTREDLVRALKTERILRENQKFIVSNTDLFASNLATLTAMQASEQTNEHGRLLNEALQIALDVQTEMRRLQQQG